jgi:hypothetical protein
MVTVPKVNINDLNSGLGSLANRVNINSIQNAAANTTSRLQAATTSTLGINVNDIVGGWQGLTAEADDVNVTSVANRGIALLQENPPGLNLINTFDPGAQSDLQNITGLTNEMTEGLNVVVAALPTAEGVGAALLNVSDKKFNELSSAISSLAPASLQSLASSSAISQLANNGLGIFNDFNSIVTTINSDFESYINQGFGQIIKDVIEATTSPIGFAIEQLTKDTGIRVSRSINLQVASLLDQGNFLGAAELLSQFSNLDIPTLETELSEISTNASDLINQLNPATSEFGTSTAPIYSIGSLDSRWDNATTVTRRPGSTQASSYAFTIIGSLEELEAELRTATREITETVIHWTANYIDQPHIGAEDVHEWHLARGFSGCGYHYIFKRDGSIQRGRPINLEGAHAADFGHNKYSIGVSHVAGYNCVSGTPNPNRYISAESISDAQWRAQKNFLEVFYRVFPGGQVLGHNQISQTGKVDPGFDVDTYILNEFGKRNAYVYNRNLPPLSREELIDARANPSVVPPGPVQAQSVVTEYPFIHPADKSKNIWTFDTLENLNATIDESGQPFGSPRPASSTQALTFLVRINDRGGQIAVVYTIIRAGDIYDWDAATLSEYVARGGSVSAETRALDNIVRIPTGAIS